MIEPAGPFCGFGRPVLGRSDLEIIIELAESRQAVNDLLPDAIDVSPDQGTDFALAVG